MEISAKRQSVSENKNLLKEAYKQSDDSVIKAAAKRLLLLHQSHTPDHTQSG